MYDLLLIKCFSEPSDFNSYSYQVFRLSVLGFCRSDRPSAFCRQIVVLFLTLCRIWGSDGVALSLDKAFKVTGNSMTRHESSHRGHNKASTLAHLSSRGGILLSFQPCGRNTCAPDLVTSRSRAVRDLMGAHPRGVLMFVRTRHAETSHAAHCGLRRRSLLPRNASLDENSCPSRAPTVKSVCSQQPKRQEKLITINY